MKQLAGWASNAGWLDCRDSQERMAAGGKLREQECQNLLNFRVIPAVSLYGGWVSSLSRQYG
jgi:hypothetical protein